jgi:hypothetical protein
VPVGDVCILASSGTEVFVVEVSNVIKHADPMLAVSLGMKYDDSQLTNMRRFGRPF